MNLFVYLLTPVYYLLEFISLFITFFIYVFNNIILWHDINIGTFLFHSDNDIYILETISNNNTECKSNKCFYYRDPHRSFGEQENEGIYFRVIRERRSKIDGNEGSDGEHV